MSATTSNPSTHEEQRAAADRVLEHFSSDNEIDVAAFEMLASTGPRDVSACPEEEEEAVMLESEPGDAAVGEGAPGTDAGADAAPEPPAAEADGERPDVPPAVSVDAAEGEGGDEAGGDDGEASDFEFEPKETLTPVASDETAPPAPTADRVQLLMRISAAKQPEQVRAWAQGAADEELMTMVRAIRELHSSWLHAESSLINMNVELSLQRHEQSKTHERLEGENTVIKNEAHELSARLNAADASGAAAAEQCVQLEARLRDKEAEVEQLTMQLQQAILEKKGAAESEYLKKAGRAVR